MSIDALHLFLISLRISDCRGEITLSLAVLTSPSFAHFKVILWMLYLAEWQLYLWGEENVTD